MAIQLFYCYASEDKEWFEKLDRHLSGLKKEYQITSWHSDDIAPGTDRKKTLIDRLNTADLILLLVSSDFLASNQEQLARALERNQAGEAKAIPILLRPVDWKVSSLSSLQMLPRRLKPITLWDNQDEAFKSVAKSIRLSLDTINQARNPLSQAPLPVPSIHSSQPKPEPFSHSPTSHLLPSRDSLVYTIRYSICLSTTIIPWAFLSKVNASFALFLLVVISIIAYIILGHVFRKKRETLLTGFILSVVAGIDVGVVVLICKSLIVGDQFSFSAARDILFQNSCWSIFWILSGTTLSILVQYLGRFSQKGR